MIRPFVAALPLLCLAACAADAGGETFEPRARGAAGKADGIDDLRGELTAEAERTPWSGYYWSMAQGELVLGWDDGQGRRLLTPDEVRAFDACLPSYEPGCVELLGNLAGDGGRQLSPLMKFDLWVRARLEAEAGPGGSAYTAYSHAALWELEHHFIGDDTSHRYWDSRGYAGKCIGWALATMDWDEPTVDRELLGVLFRPADLKGILASIYNGAQFFVPEDQVMGTEFHDANDASAEAYADVHPADFVRALLLTLGEGRILEGDLEPGDGVWNYPIHRVDLAWERETQDATELHVAATLHYANDEVDLDGVFSTDPERPDLLSRELTFDLEVPEGWDGDLAAATAGRWTGQAVDTHPDVLILGLEEGWRDSIYDYRTTNMNQEVNFQLLKRVRGEGGWQPVVDELLAEYYR